MMSRPRLLSKIFDTGLAKFKKKGGNNKVLMLLVGNKIDKRDEICVEHARGQALADDFGIPFFQTSAAKNENVSRVFESIARSFKNMHMKPAPEHTNLIEKPQRNYCN